MYLMRFIAYILIIQMWLLGFLPYQDMGELVKSSDLWNHWQHHHQTASFWDFVRLHYINYQHHEEDHDHHKDLPFHSHHTTPQGIHFLPHISIFQFERFFLADCKIKTFYQERIYSFILFEIWQPPKF